MMAQRLLLGFFFLGFLGLVVSQDASCPAPPCAPDCYFHGSCNLTTNKCDCHFGYDGKNCEKRVCERATCVYGKCNEDGSCSCDSGYIGAHCDILIGVQPYTAPVCNLDSLCVCDAHGRECTDDSIAPDLFVLEKFLKPYVEWKKFDKCDCAVGDCIDDYGLRKLLRFTVMTYNAGPADLFIGQPGQYTDDALLGDIYSWHVCHNHPHFLPWNVFRLVNDKRRNSTGHIARYVHERSKSGSTVIDSTRSSSLAPGRIRKYVDQRQGVQAGWSDWYPDYLDCQWIDITDLEPGDWTLEIEVNPLRKFKERDYDNNLLQHPLTCSPRCVHGACDFGTNCLCDDGWTGADCNTRYGKGDDDDDDDDDDEGGKGDDDDDDDESMCVPDCGDAHCGESNCPFELCGVCERHSHCKNGKCMCSPRCEGKFCGPDGCGSHCGVCMGEHEVCDESAGQCICTPSCAYKDCGFDGCYHVCGTCGEGETCVNYHCIASNATRLE